METQCMQILNHMKCGLGISQAEAQRLFGCYRLASRISDLKRRGYKIKSTLVCDRKRNGEKTRYAVYTLEENNKTEDK